MQRVKRLYYNHTPAALEDDLTFLLSSKNEAEVIFDENENQHILIYHPYLNQAEGIIYKINVYDPLPVFVIWKEDIPQGLARELRRLGKVTMNRIITNSVRRIYDSVNHEYFHTNGIYGKVKWGFSK